MLVPFTFLEEVNDSGGDVETLNKASTALRHALGCPEHLQPIDFIEMLQILGTRPRMTSNRERRHRN
jgi:hypothetical protein